MLSCQCLPPSSVLELRTAHSQTLLSTHHSCLACAVLGLNSPPATHSRYHKVPPDLLPLLLLQAKQRKKVGRPITYNGDPNSPNLTEEERRKASTSLCWLQRASVAAEYCDAWHICMQTCQSAALSAHSSVSCQCPSAGERLLLLL